MVSALHFGSSGLSLVGGGVIPGHVSHIRSI